MSGSSTGGAETATLRADALTMVDCSAGFYARSMRRAAFVSIVLGSMTLGGIAVADETSDPVPEATPTEVTPTPIPPPPAPAPAPAPAATPAPPPYPYGYGYPPYGYAPPRPSRHWYGWQTLVTDGVAFMLLYAAAQSHDHSNADTFGYSAMTVFIAAPPIVHWAHGNVGTGIGSLALRGGSCLLVAIAINSHGDDNAALGMLGILGILAAPAIDAAVFSYETAEGTTAKSSPAIAASPWVTKSGAGFGLAASF